MFSRPLLGFTLVILIALATPLASLAQSTTSATTVSFPLTPDPALCQVAPRPAADLFQFVGTPHPALDAAAGDAATPDSSDVLLPTRNPADAATTAALTSAIIELFACYNANEYLRAYSLWTDRALADVFGSEPWTKQEMTDWLATPGPFPIEEQITLLGIQVAPMLSDGRVGAVVEVAYPDGTRQRQFGLAKLENGRYRLDELRFVEPLDATPVPGTPTP